MASETLLKYGTPQLLFADHVGDFGSAPTTAANSLIIGTPTDVEMTLDTIGASGVAWQSDKTATLGATRPPLYRVDACIEFAVAPAEGDTVDFYWAGSPSATAGTGNPGGVTGADGTFTDSTGNLGEMQYIGSLICRANVICIGKVGMFSPEHLYGSLVLVNQVAQTFATTADETHITLTPIIYEGQ